MSRKYEVASNKLRSRALLVCPACGRDFMVLQNSKESPQAVMCRRLDCVHQDSAVHPMMCGKVRPFIDSLGCQSYVKAKKRGFDGPETDVRPQPVVPARSPAADTLAGAARGADPGIESYGGRSPESIVFSCWVVLAVLIAWTVLIGIFGVFKLVEWMGQ